MWNCHFWPLSASYIYIYICIVVDLAIKLICCSKDWGGVYLPLSLNDNFEQWRDHSVLCQIYRGGYIVRFTWCHTEISFYLPISWLFRMGSHWPHWKAKSSLWALAVLNGGGGIIGRGIIISLSPLVFPYIFLLVDRFKWVLIGNIGQWRVDSVLWQFWMGGGGIIISLSALVFLYIFLLVDCFEWALIGNIGQWRVDSVLWQFWMGEGG